MQINARLLEEAQSEALGQPQPIAALPAPGAAEGAPKKSAHCGHVGEHARQLSWNESLGRTSSLLASDGSPAMMLCEALLRARALEALVASLLY